VADRDSFDLFAGLDKLTGGDLDWYDKLPPEGKKTAAPFVIMRWLCGTSDLAQLVRINTFVNPYIFSLGSDKALLFKLLAAATVHKPKRYYWLKAPGAKSSRLAIEVVKQYYGWSTREAELQKVDPTDLVLMAEELGWDDEQLKKLKKEME
jgi:hypothetical protein